MRFAGKAKILIDRGIPVIPIRPNGKLPALTAHGAHDCTLDWAQIEEWDRRQPNCNSAAVATPDGKWFLDFDDPSAIAAMLQETGQCTLPETFTVMATRGPHLYFLQNDASRAMGNVVLPGVFEARVSGYYVVGPGSTHPSGKQYEIEKDVPLIEAPAWLTTWLTTKGSTMSPTKGTPGIPNASSVQESLSWLAGWVKDFNVDAIGKPIPTMNGGYKLCVPCPQKLLHTTESGPTESVILIAPDGTLAYKCQHSHCVITLNWARYREHHEPGFTADELAAFTATSIDLAAGYRASAIPASSLPATESKPPLIKHDLRFDPSCLYGRLGELAPLLKVPLGMAYLNLITAASILVPKTPGPRTNLFTVNIAPVGGFKGETAERAMTALHVPYRKSNLASDRGVEQALGKGGQVLVYQGELKALMQKGSIKGSALFPVLCEFWSSDQGGTADKHGDAKVTACMSLIGNIVVRRGERGRSDFKNLFGAETTDGFYDRCGYARADDGETTEYIERDDLHLDDIPALNPVAVHVEPPWGARRNEVVRSWELEFPDLPRQGRLGDMILRFAKILASCNGETTISERAFAAAVKICHWQCRIRRYYAPSEALNLSAQIHEAIVAILMDAGAPVPHSLLLREARYGLKCGSRDVAPEFHAMVMDGTVEQFLGKTGQFVVLSPHAVTA